MHLWSQTVFPFRFSNKIFIVSLCMVFDCATPAGHSVITKGRHNEIYSSQKPDMC